MKRLFRGVKIKIGGTYDKNRNWFKSIVEGCWE